MLRFTGSGASDVGRVRSNNEDSGFVSGSLALVADGVGGAAAGEVASATAAEAFVATIDRYGSAEDVLVRAAARARAGIRRAIQHDLTRLGMATTLTALLCRGDEVVLGHVGDSRAYRLRDGRLARLSVDHTYVARLLAAGQVRAEALARHPWRNVVLRSLDGDPAAEEIDVAPVDVQAGDRLLLCSDGLTDLLDEERVGALLASGTPATTVSRLVEAALDAGGRDNVTCVVLDVVAGAAPAAGGTRLGALADPRNIVDPDVVRP